MPNSLASCLTKYLSTALVEDHRDCVAYCVGLYLSCSFFPVPVLRLIFLDLLEIR